LTAATYALAGVALGAWLPIDVAELPWIGVVFAGVLVVWSGGLGRLTPDRSTLGRWDTAPMFVAFASLSLALVDASWVGYRPATLLGSACVVALVAAVERDRRWLIGTDALALSGLAVLGPGWLALGLSATSVISLLAALRSAPAERVWLQVTNVASACGAWFVFLVWIDASGHDATVSTTVLSGALALGLAVGVRWLRLTTDWALAWLGAVALGLAIGIAVASSTSSVAVRDDALLALAVALGLGAVATALAAAPLSQPWMRTATVGVVALAGGSFALGSEATLGGAAWTAMVVGLVGTLVALCLVTMRPASPWLQPWVVAGGVASSVAIVVSVSGFGNGDLHASVAMAALLAAAVEAAALGTTMRNTEILALSPLLACAGWLVFAHDALVGEPLWFGVPIGLALLVDTGLIRWRHRTDGEPVATSTLIALDDIGMIFVLSTPLLEAVTEHPLYAAVGIALGTTICVWGVVTKVRRRVVGGASGVVGGVLLLVALPLAQLVPKTTAPAAWTVIAAAGAVMIVIAAYLEHGQARVRHSIGRLETLMDGWE
jgi:hypothetical protein